ncbi:hypothetical protein B296_00019846 [Ensete ventricosum]|uniref:Uncharacterized protein n=1 Tax=Ensete ventricosum TaxID=4639 RepID=A0A426YP18_ENSVE|nr:hypothetical protein B296_00019846 [Ensete ventricosum]
MLLPRFHNSGIRAKVFVQKIDFKLRVMRLNNVESFYVFLLCFRSEGSEEEGRLATSSPHAGPIGYDHDKPAREASGARKGRQSLVGAAAHMGGAYGQKRYPRAQPLAARRPQGGSTAGRPQGAVACD